MSKNGIGGMEFKQSCMCLAVEEMELMWISIQMECMWTTCIAFQVIQGTPRCDSPLDAMRHRVSPLACAHGIVKCIKNSRKGQSRMPSIAFHLHASLKRDSTLVPLRHRVSWLMWKISKSLKSLKRDGTLRPLIHRVSIHFKVILAKSFKWMHHWFPCTIAPQHLSSIWFN